MGKRGPAAKPIPLRVLEGNPGHQKLNRNEPKPTPKAPTRPEWLLPEAKHEWKRIVPELERLGLLTLVDRAALAAYCQAWARAVEAEAIVTKNGTSYQTETGQVKPRPEVAIAMREWQLVRAFASEFGLTPAARTRIEVEKPPADDPDGDLDC